MKNKKISVSVKSLLENLMTESSHSTVEILTYCFTILAVAVSLAADMPVLADMIVLPVFSLCVLNLKYNKMRILRICVIFLLFQNFVIGVMAHLLGYSGPDLSFLTQIPFLFVCLAFAITTLWRWQAERGVHLKLEDYSFVILLLLLGSQFVISNGSTAAKIVGVRNYITFYLAYCIARECVNDKEELLVFFRFLVGLGIFAVLIGLILYPMSFSTWETIGIREVYLAKKDVIIGNSFPGRYHTNFLGYEVNRIASLYYEPVNFAYLISASLLVAVFAPWSQGVLKRTIASAFLTLGLFLTFGKGGMMITGLGIAAYFFFKVLRWASRGEERRIKNILLLVLIPVIYFAGTYYVFHYDASTNPHFVGIVSTWKSVLQRPLGYGLGNGGNANLMFDGVGGNSYWEVYDAWLSSGGETALMAFIYQMGIPSFVVFFLCFHGVTTRVAKGNGMGCFRYMVMMLPYILLSISIYQENTYTPQCIVPFMLLVGGMAGYDELTSGEKTVTTMMKMGAER